MTNQRKVLIGFSITLIVLLTVVCSLTAVFVVALRPYAAWVAGGFAGLGLALLIYGNRLDKASDARPGGAHEKHPLSFFAQETYWGWILMLSSLPVLVFWESLCNPLVVAARPLPKPKPVAVAVAPPPPAPKPIPAPPIEFPPLKLKGLVCNGPLSSAVLNGESLRIGERVAGVTVVAIQSWGVTVEMDGQRKNLALEQR